MFEKFMGDVDKTQSQGNVSVKLYVSVSFIGVGDRMAATRREISSRI